MPLRVFREMKKEATAMGNEFVQLSLTPMLIGVLAAIACALPGNFLILRRQALIGDAISHVVLPVSWWPSC